MRAVCARAVQVRHTELGLPLVDVCASSENYIRTIARYIDHVVIHWQPLFSLRFLARYEILPVYGLRPLSYRECRRPFDLNPPHIFGSRQSLIAS